MSFDISIHSPLRRIEVDITQGEEVTASMLLKSEGSAVIMEFALSPAEINALKSIVIAHTDECPLGGARCEKHESPT